MEKGSVNDVPIAKRSSSSKSSGVNPGSHAPEENVCGEGVSNQTKGRRADVRVLNCGQRMQNLALRRILGSGSGRAEDVWDPVTTVRSVAS